MYLGYELDEHFFGTARIFRNVLLINKIGPFVSRNRVFHNSCLIIRFEQIEFWQDWGLSPGYPDHFSTALTITPQSQLCW